VPVKIVIPVFFFFLESEYEGLENLFYDETQVLKSVSQNDDTTVVIASEDCRSP
jgi:hypothetical protein